MPWVNMAWVENVIGRVLGSRIWRNFYTPLILHAPGHLVFFCAKMTVLIVTSAQDKLFRYKVSSPPSVVYYCYT